MGIEWEQDKRDDSGDIKLDEEAIKQYEKDLLKVLQLGIKEQVISAVIPSLGPQNFEGEAIEFMRTNGIPLVESEIKRYSRVILKEFVDNVDDMISYDEQEDKLIVSPFIIALEFGDFYRPLLKTITRAVDATFAELLVN